MIKHTGPVHNIHDVPDLGEVAGARVLEHGVHQPVAGLGQVRPVNAVAVPEHDLRLDENKIESFSLVVGFKQKILVGRDNK